MTDTGDTVILHQELAHSDVLPVAFRSITGDFAAADVALWSERNLRTLQAFAALEEQGSYEKPDEMTAHSADILRVDRKINLLLDLVGHLIAASQSRPQPSAVRFNAHGAVWETSGPVPVTGAHGIVEIHLRECLAQPLLICGTVAPSPGPGRVHVRFDPLPEPVSDQLEKLVFRRHRRSIAGGRQSRRS